MVVPVVVHSAAERASVVDPTIEKKRARFPTLIKMPKSLDGIDVAARHFVYKLYDTADGQQWSVLHGMHESAATISRAVERGWVILQDARGKPGCQMSRD